MPIPASYLTSATPSTSDSFPPHTSSGATSVITAVKASIGSPFFHAHLQEGRRIEEGSDVTSIGSSIGGPGARSGASGSGSSRRVSTLITKTLRSVGPSAGTKQRDAPEAPHGSRARANPQPAEKPARGAGVRVAVPSAKSQLYPQDIFPCRSAGSSPARAMAFPIGVDEQDVWMAEASAQAAAASGVAVPPSKRYHYITRSQSLDAGLQQQAPRMRKPNASYNALYGTQSSQMYPFAPGPPMRMAEDSRSTNANAKLWAALAPAVQGRHLSPIDEATAQLGERHGETASLRSNASTQTNLFIHRSVRRTPSTSTMNSSHSAAESPARGYGHGRGFGDPLPVIPASPRESQNVFEPDHAMMPNIFPHEAQPLDYSSYSMPLREQDLGETGYAILSDKKPQTHMRYALPNGMYTEENESSSLEEQDLGAPRQPARVSTPSLLSRSESIRTELTYLTAQDSAPGSRRVSAALDLEAGRRRSRLAEVTNADELPDNMAGRAVARMKASFDTLLARGAKTPSPVQGTSSKPPSSRRTSTKNVTALKSVRFGAPTWAVHTRAQIAETFRGGKPAEVLFWTGFLAPWCWLIGGWMLLRGTGEAPPPEQPVILGNDSAGTSRTQSRLRRTDKQRERKRQVSRWNAARSSSAEVLVALRGERVQVHDEEKGESEAHENVNGDTQNTAANSCANAGVNVGIEKQPAPARIGDALRESATVDPWVARCRVAAVLAGMLLLALCIVALIVLVRSL